MTKVIVSANISAAENCDKQNTLRIFGILGVLSYPLYAPLEEPDWNLISCLHLLHSVLLCISAVIGMFLKVRSGNFLVFNYISDARISDISLPP